MTGLENLSPAMMIVGLVVLLSTGFSLGFIVGALWATRGRGE